MNIRIEEEADVVIVGAGAAGLVFARELAQAGFNTVVLERGPDHGTNVRDFQEDERALAFITWSNRDYIVTGDGFTGAPNLGWGVGGGTLAWTAVAGRLLPHDVAFASNHGTPEGSNVADWPFGIEELTPYYEQAEHDMGVSGKLSPWDAPSTRPPPNPAFGYYRSSWSLREGMKSLGMRTAPGHVARNSKDYGDRPKCVHCGYCRSGCRTDAKYQADRALLKDVRGLANFSLRTEVVVQRLYTSDQGGRVSAVTYLDTRTGSVHRLGAKIVIVCNNPIEIPRLLLSSRDRFHPAGLGNAHDQIGRNFFCHPTAVGMGITEECINVSHGATMANIVTRDCGVSLKPDAYVGGFSLESLNGAGAGSIAAYTLSTLWGKKLKDTMRKYNDSLLLIAFCEGLPVRTNRITVDMSSLDANGLPRARIHYALHENDKRVFKEASDTIKRVMAASGAYQSYVNEHPFESHPMGTMRMGRSPRDSATDVFGKVHGLKNLFVGGAALFPTGGSWNPTLTLHALALRTAQFIKDNWAGIV